MKTTDKEYIIKEFSQRFKELSPVDIDYLSDNASVVKYDAGDIIFKEGEFTSHIVFLITGLVKIVREHKNNKSIILKVITDKNFVGLIPVMGKRVFDFSAAAMSSCTALSIHVEVFKQIMTTNSNFVTSLVHDLSEESLSVINHLITINQKQLPGRVADVILFFYQLYKSEEITIPMSRKELAEFAGTSKESFIRTLAEFRDDKIIDVIDHRRIVINSPTLLVKLSKFG